MSDEPQTVLSSEALSALCRSALLSAGASAEQAEAVTQATLEAELGGRSAVGVPHLFDYLNGFRAGRIHAETPQISTNHTAFIHVDCRGGVAQSAFRAAESEVVSHVTHHGMAVLSLHHSFTVGELDYYVRRVNAHGYLALAVANSPALMSVGNSHSPLFGTNPMAFGVPLPDGRRLSFDQASSASAWVAIRDAAQSNEPIPDGWAVDKANQPTRSAHEALSGSLLPFGAHKGGNIALLVEVLATLAGGTFSTEAAPFTEGDESPAVGLFLIAIDCDAIQPGYLDSLSRQIEHWRSDFGANTNHWLDRDRHRHCRISVREHDLLNEWAKTITR